MLYFSGFFIILFTICSIVFLLSIILAKKTKLNREKASPFECGFDPNSNLRLPFSLRFFLITVIFLIFDVEIAVLLPATIALPLVNSFHWFLTTGFFLLILILGLFHEWNQGALEWAS
uniref:NADH-ubiquinone oxidoreductase chain 3 n=1 Tax=Diaphanosoma excisum TaxID=2094052 RepID=A0A8A1RXI1_9CRUS|nr:NADH dehydrogenase subunit 3 [Diaphanosoma excisum]QST19914.1 NADH dehydrogenase subunit 3 [Diaphanosoma excisum]